MGLGLFGAGERDGSDWVDDWVGSWVCGFIGWCVVGLLAWLLFLGSAEHASHELGVRIRLSSNMTKCNTLKGTVD